MKMIMKFKDKLFQMIQMEVSKPVMQARVTLVKVQVMYWKVLVLHNKSLRRKMREERRRGIRITDIRNNKDMKDLFKRNLEDETRIQIFYF